MGTNTKLRRRAGLPAMVGAALLLSGCWGQIGGNAGHTRANGIDGGVGIDNVHLLVEDWSAELGAAALTEPVVLGGQVFTTRSSPPQGQFVDAFATATGERAWESAVGGGRAGGATPVAASGQELWVAGNAGVCGSGELLRLDPLTGGTVDSEATLVGTPVVTGEGVVAYVVNDACPPDGPDRLVVRDAETGEELWSFTFPERNVVHDTSPVRTTRSDQTPTISGGQVYVANASTLYSFDLESCGTPTCEPLWTQTYPEEALWAPVDHPRYGTVVVASNEVDVALGGVRYDEARVRMVRNDGHELTRQSRRGVVLPPAFAHETIYLAFQASSDGSGDNVVLGLNPHNGGSLIWQYVTGERPTAIAVGGDVLYVAVEPIAAEGTVRALPAKCPSTGCLPRISLATPGSPQQVSVAGGQVFVTSAVAPGTMALTAYGLLGATP